MESIAVVIIIAILIVLGIVFAASQKIETADTEAVKIQEADSITIALKVAGLREIKCSKNSESGNTCLDLYRVKALSETIKDTTLDADKYYNDIFKRSKISIRPIYPKIELVPGDSTIKTMTIYEYELPLNPDGTIKEKQQVTRSFFPVLLYDPLEDKNIFAMLEISVYK